MARTTRGDWVTAGLAILRDEGDASLTIEQLCRRLGRTKGAFYHHFPELADYHEALLTRWEHDLTAKPIADARADHARLGEVVRGLDHQLDLAVRAWAKHEPRAAAVLARVDATRVEHLAALWAAKTARRGGALTLARLEYAAFVGVQQLYPDLSSSVARGLDASLARALLLLARDEKTRRRVTSSSRSRPPSRRVDL